jgi:hypothetical protein
MKEANVKASLFMLFAMIVIVVLVLGIMIITGVNIEQLPNKITNLLGQVYPKISEVT